ncbi:hypothetical protein HDU77_011326 [Chytriomyces hyalinus]|nr:hypothetical protein HDU77_011326 [Chytriomyces hyalinus]
MSDERQPLLQASRFVQSSNARDRFGRFFVVSVLLAFTWFAGYWMATSNNKAMDWTAISSDIEQWRNEFGVAGIAVGVVRGGKLVFAKGFGARNKDGDDVTPDTLFHIGSTSKAFTVFSVASLVDEKKLTWKTPVTALHPVEFMDPATNKQANLIDLLSHRTGIPRYDLAMWLASSSSEMIRKIKHMLPVAQLREEFHYNNHMFTLAGTIAADAYGSSWDQLVQDRILKPLQMSSTLTDPKDLQHAIDHARAFSNVNGTLVQLPYEENDWVNVAKPAGSIMSSVRDLSKWVAFMNRRAVLENGTQLLSKPQFDQIITQHMPIGVPVSDSPIQLTGYGLGWMIDSYRGKPRVWHNGGLIGYITQIDTIPSEDLAVIVLTNTANVIGPVISQTIVDRLLFPAVKFDWAQNLRNTLESARLKAKEARQEIIEKRQNNTKPSLGFEKFEGVYTEAVLGYLKLSLMKDTRYFSMEMTNDLKNKWTPMGVVGHWENDVFGIFEMRIPKYNDYDAPYKKLEFRVKDEVLGFNAEIEDNIPLYFKRMQ